MAEILRPKHKVNMKKMETISLRLIADCIKKKLCIY